MVNQYYQPGAMPCLALVSGVAVKPERLQRADRAERDERRGGGRETGNKPSPGGPLLSANINTETSPNRRFPQSALLVRCKKRISVERPERASRPKRPLDRHLGGGGDSSPSVGLQTVWRPLRAPPREPARRLAPVCRRASFHGGNDLRAVRRSFNRHT